MNLLFKKIQPLLSTNEKNISKWAGYFGLGIGIFILLISLQTFINISKLLSENNERKSGYDFVSLSKNITNENMGKDNTFNEQDVDHLKNQTTIEDVSPLISNQFRVRATAGDVLPFSTDLFLESLSNNFLDTLPPSFSWQPGQQVVPIIFSSDFLEMYNVFAPAQGLPQLSPQTISLVNITLECSGPSGMQMYKGNIVALSDRINSILVPHTFMNYNNWFFTKDTSLHAARVFIKTKDANNPSLLKYLDKNDYHINKDKIRFGRIKSILQGVLSGMGILGLLVVVLALMLFAFYLQLMIARSKDNLRLLVTLGYSPNWLSKQVTKKWILVYGYIILLAVIVTQVFNYFFASLSISQKNGLPVLLHWSVLLLAFILFILSILMNYRLVKKELVEMKL
ncbi:MAG: hypothetical protein JSS98_09520 [Bacteroidetes bacterium]|nr:hypothetical protein [Bacteroidota bacterium]